MFSFCLGVFVLESSLLGGYIYEQKSKKSQEISGKRREEMIQFCMI